MPLEDLVAVGIRDEHPAVGRHGERPRADETGRAAAGRGRVAAPERSAVGRMSPASRCRGVGGHTCSAVSTRRHIVVQDTFHRPPTLKATASKESEYDGGGYFAFTLMVSGTAASPGRATLTGPVLKRTVTGLPPKPLASWVPACCRATRMAPS